MTGSTFSKLTKDINAKHFSPVYILMGEESYYIDYLSDLIISNAITEDERDFNFTDFYGLDADVNTVINSCKRFPMMAERQVVVVHEAQLMDKIDLLQHYLAKPLESTILIICHKGSKIKAPETIKIAKKSDQVILFESKGLTESSVGTEILDFAKQNNLNMDAKAISMLKEHIGTDISNLHRSLEKLSIIVPEGRVITAELIEEHIGISKDYNNFELLNAIQKRDPNKAMQILNYFRQDPKNHSVIPMASTLFGFFSKAILFHTVKDRSQQSLMNVIETKNEYRLKHFSAEAAAFSPRDCFYAIGWIRDLDTKCKGINSYQDEYDLLKDTIFKIIFNRS